MGGETGVRGVPAVVSVRSDTTASLLQALQPPGSSRHCRSCSETSGSRPSHFDGFQPARPFVAGVLPGTTQTVVGRDTTSRLRQGKAPSTARVSARVRPAPGCPALCRPHASVVFLSLVTVPVSSSAAGTATGVKPAALRRGDGNLLLGGPSSRRPGRHSARTSRSVSSAGLVVQSGRFVTQTTVSVPTPRATCLGRDS